MYNFVQSWLNNWDESHSGRKLWNHVIAWRSSVHFQETRVAWSDITCMQSLNMELQHRSNLRLEVTWSDHSKALWTINLYKLHQPHCDVEMMLNTAESSSKWPDFRLIVSPESWKNKFGLWQDHGAKFLSICFFWSITNGLQSPTSILWVEFIGTKFEPFPCLSLKIWYWAVFKTGSTTIQWEIRVIYRVVNPFLTN